MLTIVSIDGVNERGVVEIVVAGGGKSRVEASIESRAFQCGLTSEPASRPLPLRQVFALLGGRFT